MGTLTIGRVGVDLDLDPAGIQKTTQRGREVVAITGEVSLTDSNQSKALAHKIERLPTTEELLVPLTFSGEPTLDGYYRVTDAILNTVIGSANGFYPFSCQLERIGSEGRVEIESVISSAERTNDFGGITPVPILGVPTQADAWRYRDGSAIPTSFTRTFGGGNVRMLSGYTVGKVPVWSIAASAFYNRACYVKVDDGSTTNKEVVIGRDIPNKPTDFEIGNDGLRVTYNGSNCQLKVEFYDGTDWRSHPIELYSGGATIAAPAYISVLMNTAATCGIRLVVPLAGSTGAVTVDIWVRRGARFIEVVYSRDRAATLKVRNVNVEAGTAITAGQRATANDGNTNRYVFSCPLSHTLDATNGGLQIASVTELPFMFGLEVGGTGAASGDAATDLVDQYFQAITEIMNPIIR